MKSAKYIILGAGPSGLTFANMLLKNNEYDFLIIERENEPGGLCRSQVVDEKPLDIGGGHFLDVRNKDVCNLLFEFLPEKEWNIFDRISTIKLNETYIDYPIESNIWQLPVDTQLNYIESITQAGCIKGEDCPEKFSDWITWKLGSKIAEDYMLPYNKKIFDIDLDELGTYWLYKLPDVSFRDILKSCLIKKPISIMPGHAHFYYPKDYGYGEVWLRMGAALQDKLICNEVIHNIDIDNKIINGKYKGEIIINTIPWKEFIDNDKVSAEVYEAVQKLEYTSIDVDYIQKEVGSPAYWTYIPDVDVTYHRILNRSNFLPNSRGYWTETNSRRSSGEQGFRYTNQYAYPLNKIDKPHNVKIIHEWAKENGIIPLGRWGNWEHMNSDAVVQEAISLANSIFNKTDNRGE